MSGYPLEMVLNALGLYFVCGIDNDAVYFGDYKKLANWIEVEYDDFLDDQYKASHGGEITQQCSSISNAIIKLVELIGNRDYNVYFLLPIAFISPIYMLACY